MDELNIVSPYGALTLTNPKMLCPVHGIIDDGWVVFSISGVESPKYCLRCAMHVFTKQGISVVTPVDGGVEQ